ncbi:AraC family transcriptional regulator [Streptomyces sp. NPDC046203]|uniref:AraC family transcriptional regulator n=1 Tax=Streptomyces sp. NPDC046203 TaxID=3154602 RepID=UPI0033E3A992
MRGTARLPDTPPVHRLELRLPDDVPFAIGSFDEIGPYSRAAFPHRHTFFEIVHVTRGTGTHVVDLDRWELSPPHLGVIVPGQVHHWEDTRGLDGSVVLFTPDFLVGQSGDTDLLRRIGARPWHRLDPVAHARTGRLLAELSEEYGHGDPGFATVLRSLLRVLLVRMTRLPDRPASGTAAGMADGVPGPGAGSGPGSDVVGAEVRAGRHAVAEEFARLLAATEPGALGSVRECADRLGLTPGYLTEALRAAVGRTPGSLLREARTREAQRLLARTDLSVRQVAARTGFDDPAYFCRFFRRETGMSPGGFRKHHDSRAPSIEAGPGPA